MVAAVNISVAGVAGALGAALRRRRARRGPRPRRDRADPRHCRCWARPPPPSASADLGPGVVSALRMPPCGATVDRSTDRGRPRMTTPHDDPAAGPVTTRPESEQDADPDADFLDGTGSRPAGRAGHQGAGGASAGGARVPGGCLRGRGRPTPRRPGARRARRASGRQAAGVAGAPRASPSGGGSNGCGGGSAQGGARPPGGRRERDGRAELGEPFGDPVAIGRRRHRDGPGGPQRRSGGHVVGAGPGGPQRRCRDRVVRPCRERRPGPAGRRAWAR